MPPPPGATPAATPGPPVAPNAPLPAMQPEKPEKAPPPLPQPPPTIGPDSHLATRQPSEEIENPFERQASMILDAAETQAARLAENMGQTPVDHKPIDEATIHEMFHFSPYGTDAPREFWRQHDQLMQEAIQHGDADPYAVAEQGALQAVYPYRYQLGGMDTLGPQQRVERAAEIEGIVNREVAKGNTPDAMPSIVGPRGLPSPANPAPNAPAPTPPAGAKPEPLWNSSNPATMGGPA